MWDGHAAGDDDDVGGAYGGKSKNALVDISLFVDELTGLQDEEGSYFMVRWRRGREHEGETPYEMVVNGVVSWKRNFIISGVTLPRESIAANKKYFDFTFYKKEPADVPYGSVKVEVYFHGEKRKKAELQFSLAETGGDETMQRLKLAIAMQLKEQSRHSAPTSPIIRPARVTASTLPPLRSASQNRSGKKREDFSVERSMERSQSPVGDLPLDFLRTADGSTASLETMKMNILKLYGKIQDSESRLGEKKREIREVRTAFANLKTDYEHLHADLDNAEQRCHRLKDDLSREQNMNRELMEIKARLEAYAHVGTSDESGSRNCDAGCCVQ